jgi:hypothetical protein
MTALVKRVAPAKPQQPQPDTFAASVALDRFDHVFRARRIVTAGRGKQRGNERLIPSQDTDDKALHLQKTRFISRQRSGRGASNAVLRGLKTRTQPSASAWSSARTASRMRRRIRFRMTAFPNARGHVNPNREGLLGSASLAQKATKYRLEIRVPPW